MAVHVVLSGWKPIARYLDCGVRTAQRWEDAGLPIQRPTKFSRKRGVVVANSEELDSWRLNAAFWRTQTFDVLASVERARRLRREVHEARETLRLKRQALKNEVAALKAKIKNNKKVELSGLAIGQQGV